MLSWPKYRKVIYPLKEMFPKFYLTMGFHLKNCNLIKFSTLSFFPVPLADGRRRHSYQSGAAGASALVRDMERLKVGEAGAQAGAGAKPGVSPRPSKKRRASTRRSSRSGQFKFHSMNFGVKDVFSTVFCLS